MSLEYVPAKSIVFGYSNGDQWFGCNYNMNIYKGCCHGCIYCDSRSECYHIDDFDRVRAKANTIDILSKQLVGKRQKGVIGTGAMSDPYNPYEAEARLTRGALELIDFNYFGISITTKSALITRDIDLLTRIRRHSPTICQITVTSASDELSRMIEPGVSLSSERFDAIRQLTDAGIYADIMMTPILPFINDTPENIIGIIEKAHQCGARFIYPGFGVTLRTNQRDYFFEQIDDKFPMVKSKYLKQFGNKYVCNSPNHRELRKLFTSNCKKYGILYRMADIIKAYKSEYECDSEQLSMELI